MNDAHMRSIEDIREYLQAKKKVHITIKSREDRYAFIQNLLVRLRYRKLRKKDKGDVIQYIALHTNYSAVQLKRLFGRWKEGALRYGEVRAKHNRIKKVYYPKDIALLIATDVAHGTLSGNATKSILRRQVTAFGQNEYETIAGISIAHLYNIRNDSRQYRSSEAARYTKTQAVNIPIGERRKPSPDGKPGYLRIDSVHQGDFEGAKGVYHINIVDEVTQWEVVGATERINEYFLEQLLPELLAQFPFTVHNFHSDNGSEYINKVVSRILESLRIKQTKSRSRHCNDNALVESKNGSIIRKHMGRSHIPQKYAPRINQFYRTFFNPYLNFHRPCGFATLKIDRRGKEKKKYDIYLTPYEKFLSLENASSFLKFSVTFELLEKIAYTESDNDLDPKI